MNTAAEMPKYQSHKIVHALKLIGFEPSPLTMGYNLLPQDPAFDVIHVSSEWMREKKVKLFGVHDAGYYVVYPDGYASWSPTEAFEKGYTLYHTPRSCGCPGGFHSSSCSDQNPLDPLGSIIDPRQREAIRSRLLKDGVKPTI